MPEHGETLASFAATHEDRLVRSLVSETGLSPASAARVVADVLPVAFHRGFATQGAAYGWLRVAARHRAAGSTTWSDAADAALGRADTALSALACLSAADRELLRLRYVEGLRTDTLAERLGVPVATVSARLDRLHAAAARALPAAAVPAPRPPVRALDDQRGGLAVSLPRFATAAAAVAAAVAVSSSPAPTTTPPLAGRPLAPYTVPGTTVAGGGDAPTAVAERPGRAVTARAAARPTVTTVTPPVDDTEHPPGSGGCGDRCGTVRFFDEIHIRVPKDAAPALGDDEIVVAQEVAGEYVRACDALETLPREHAYCERSNQ